MRYILGLLFLLLFTSLSSAQGRRLYVDAYATGANNGASWDDAFSDLQSALFAAQSGDCIWVALGAYKPTDTYNREISFNLKSGVKLYGGFAGVETELEQRNWERFKTILSGNIGLPDDNTDNSYTILYIETSDSETVVDGFTFSGGMADNYDPYISKYAKEKCGGAIYIAAKGTVYPEIHNCSFENNYAREFGGAVYLFTGEGKEEVLPFENCWFANNRSDGTPAADKAANTSFRVFPNPANNTVTIEGYVENAAFPLKTTLYDGLGKMVHSVDVHEFSKELSIRISLTGLSAGCYNFRIADAENTVLDAGTLCKQ